MTFHCRNYDMVDNKCKKLNGDCVPGRKGCVLEGRVALCEELEAKIKAIDAQVASRVADRHAP
ncbi:MAG: hypothetical protein ABFS19_10610 [Thermodesulfobacteriota bacterium]